MKIIAEVGSNYKTKVDIMSSVAIAKECGADAVKFQMFSPWDLYGEGSKERNLSEDLLPLLRDEAIRCEIELMCSAFSPEGYEIVNRYVNTHKIASCELTDLDILKKVNSFKKPVIISRGGSTIDEAKAYLAYLCNCRVTLMYCAGDYPARIINLNELIHQREAMPTINHGYSDHSTDVLVIPQVAKILYATVLEKHVDFFNCKESPDHGHALNEQEFKLMCDDLHNLNITLPDQSVRAHRRVYNTATQSYVRPHG